MAMPLPNVRTASDMLRETTAVEGVRAFWLQRLTSQAQRFGVPELADMLEETDWTIGELQRGLRKLIADGLVANVDDILGKRRTNFVDFEKGERLVRVG